MYTKRVGIGLEMWKKIVEWVKGVGERLVEWVKGL